jgi:hypothetical protein
MYANLIRKLKKTVQSEKFVARHRKSSKDFTRTRQLPFRTLIYFLLNLVKGSLQDELDHFFKAIHGTELPERVVTKSAFTLARKKLQYSAFEALNQEAVDFFYTQPHVRLWQGMRLLCIDGSTVRLPNSQAITEYFGTFHVSGNSCSLARVSQLFDPLNQITVDGAIAPKSEGERVLAVQHCEHITNNDLILLDRGYPAFWLFALILSKNANFCCRVPLKLWTSVKDFYASGKMEQRITIKPSLESTMQCEKLGISSSPITLRLIRVTLENGETEILMTSLLSETLYPQEIFKGLYHQRWGVEENYKAIKCRVQLENFTGLSVLAIYQDFYAKLLLTNLAAIMAWQAQRVIDENNGHKKYRHKVNFSQTIARLKDSLILLFIRGDISKLLRKLLHLCIITVEPIRPGRSYPRKRGVKRNIPTLIYRPGR